MKRTKGKVYYLADYKYAVVYMGPYFESVRSQTRLAPDSKIEQSTGININEWHDPYKPILRPERFAGIKPERNPPKYRGWQFVINWQQVSLSRKGAGNWLQMLTDKDKFLNFIKPEIESIIHKAKNWGK